jgi:hypothetical protein
VSALVAKARTFPSTFCILKYRLRLSSQTVATKLTWNGVVVKVSLRSAVRFQMRTPNLVSLRMYRSWESRLLVGMSFDGDDVIFVDYQGYHQFPDASKCLVSLNYLILPPSPSMIFAAAKAAEINHNGDQKNQ